MNKMVRICGTLAVSVALLLPGCGGNDGSPSSLSDDKPAEKNFHDAAFLADSLSQKIQSKLTKIDDAAVVHSVDCIAKNKEKTEFTCLLKYHSSDLGSQSETVNVTVAADGLSYISQ